PHRAFSRPLPLRELRGMLWWPNRIRTLGERNRSIQNVSKETVFINGKIFTARDENEIVSAFDVRDGEITRVGDGTDMSGAEVVDLGGRTVVPGFIDVHTHPTYTAMTRSAVPCTCPVVISIPELIEALKKH